MSVSKVISNFFGFVLLYKAVGCKNERQFTSFVTRSHNFFSRFKSRPNDRKMPTQHIATLLGAACCVRLATLLRHAATCWVLLAQIWPFSNFSQQHPTCRNMVAKPKQHVAPNNVAICCVGMLQSFGRSFKSASRICFEFWLALWIVVLFDWPDWVFSFRVYDT